MASKRLNTPDFIIIGAMKCATSTVHDQLANNSPFFMTTPKEPNFFSNDDYYNRGHRWYSALFDQAERGTLKGESSTHYTKLPEYPRTIERIMQYCPDVKLIYIMRHPVDRLVSHYIHQWTQGVISCGIDKAVQRFPELINCSCYNMQIEPFLRHFGKSNVLPLFSERLNESPLTEMHAIYRFLGVTTEPVWYESIRSNVSKERLRVSAWRDAIVRNRFVTYIRKKFIPKRTRAAIRGLWSMKERPRLSLESQRHVEDIFDNDLKKLGNKLDLKLNCTNFKEIIKSEKNIVWV